MNRKRGGRWSTVARRLKVLKALRDVNFLNHLELPNELREMTSAPRPKKGQKRSETAGRHQSSHSFFTVLFYK